MNSGYYQVTGLTTGQENTVTLLAYWDGKHLMQVGETDRPFIDQLQDFEVCWVDPVEDYELSPALRARLTIIEGGAA